MSSFSFQACCRLFAIDPKTLRQWLAQAQMSLQMHPKDARIKCLSDAQVQTLARLHGLAFPRSSAASEVHSRPEQMMSCSDADIHMRLAQLEAQVTTLQAQLTDLALQLLKERQYSTELQRLAFQTQERLEDEPSFPSPLLSIPYQPLVPPLVCHPTEKRNRLIPLIEYGARGQYVLISPEEGEISLVPDSPEWFTWLASLSSFRFVGQAGRFSARRGYNRRPNRSWYAQRTIHQQFRSKYIGISEHVTIARLEHIAAELQSSPVLR